MALPKIKCWDVFEIETTKGMAYLQCVKESLATDLEIVRILNGLYLSADEVNISAMINEKELYFIQLPLKYAVKKKCITFIGNFIPEKEIIVPRYYRAMHKIGSEFICWHIVDSETLQRRSALELCEEEIRLSPWGSWNDTLLAERIASGWRLETWR